MTVMTMMTMTTMTTMVTMMTMMTKDDRDDHDDCDDHHLGGGPGSGAHHQLLHPLQSLRGERVGRGVGTTRSLCTSISSATVQPERSTLVIFLFTNEKCNLKGQ